VSFQPSQPRSLCLLLSQSSRAFLLPIPPPGSGAAGQQHQPAASHPPQQPFNPPPPPQARQLPPPAPCLLLPLLSARCASAHRSSRRFCRSSTPANTRTRSTPFPRCRHLCRLVRLCIPRNPRLRRPQRPLLPHASTKSSRNRRASLQPRRIPTLPPLAMLHLAMATRL
jgi:hypothetical protein